MTLALDHVFVFVDAADAAPGGRIRTILDAAGLVPSFTRRHTGQGTANVCYCFDDAYLELLFVVDRAELAAPEIARTGLADRADWRTTGASPFGIALRGGPMPFPTWDYRFAALPPGFAIPVAVDSDDPRVPFLFGSPGTAPPTEWTDGRAGARQTRGAYTSIIGVRLELSVAPAPSLAKIAALGIIDIIAAGDKSEAVVLTLGRDDGGSLQLRLP